MSPWASRMRTASVSAATLAAAESSRRCLHAGGAVGEALADDRSGELVEQREDDERRRRADQHLRERREDRILGDVALVVEGNVVLLLGALQDTAGEHRGGGEEAHADTPIASATAALTASDDGVLPVASWPANDATSATADSTCERAASLAASTSAAAAARFSAMRALTSVRRAARSASSVAACCFDLLLGLGANAGDLCVVVGDVGPCGGGQVLGLLGGRPRSCRNETSFHRAPCGTGTTAWRARARRRSRSPRRLP